MVGQGEYTYFVDTTWGRRSGGVPTFGVGQGVTGDSQDNVYVLQRAPVACIFVFDRSGELLKTWGEGSFRSPHGIWMTEHDELLITDRQAHTITRWTVTGELLRSWGSQDIPGEWGKPFNGPTKAVEAADGELYVADGYGNRHLHRFDKDGGLIRSWGGEGTESGQFALPHDVFIDGENRVLVCDRENQRVQHFDRDGGYLGEWSPWQSPMQIFARAGLMYVAHARAAISVRTPTGELLASWPYESTLTHTQERSPHSVWVDSRGDIYVGEVVGENGFQKFVRG